MSGAGIIFDLDSHLEKVADNKRERLSIVNRDALLVALRHDPFLTLQSEILRNVNGRLNRLATLDLTKEGAMLNAAREQGVIQGLRLFFDIATDLLSSAETDGGTLE